ncbi:HAD-IIA family hydrolase [Alteribacillus iranensis]|uniref:4-nitrophenyl phosphatase/NagD protein n=1 Tax=Alteribacillus iranensis TaxID=930128 RepID=A0A1I2BJ74_9BACI|nr:HAD-IIA family hydrolase [Alteribacillus iranensis]SFE56196.1 4-nitrophenyl phosphatase/NagD protein [Alteribacillus iranensis]
MHETLQRVEWEKIKGFFFDLDGCMYAGDKPYPRSQELILYLLQQGKKVAFLSNNSTDRTETVRKRMRRMGFLVEKTPIVLASELVGDYLNKKVGNVAAAIFGSDELKESVQKAGHTLVDSPIDVSEVVIVGRDETFSYQKLQFACDQLSHHSRLIAVNADVSHPRTNGKMVPDTGSLIAAIEAVTGVEAEIVGKPSTHAFEHLCQVTGLSTDECLMVGDNLYTDVEGGERSGMHTCWITHGKTKPDFVSVQPTIEIPAIANLYDLLIQKRKHILH